MHGVCLVLFSVQCDKSETRMIHKAELRMDICVRTLKSDLAEMFAMPADDQEWYYGPYKLMDDKTLVYYNMPGVMDKSVKILVKGVKKMTSEDYI